MFIFVTMDTASDGSLLLDGKEEQFIREASMAHLLAVFVFVLLWRLHRFLGRTLFDDLIDSRKSATASPNFAAPPSTGDVSKDKQLLLQNNRLSPDLLPDEDDLWIQKQAPDSTFAERLRFFVASNRRSALAAKNLQTYIDWHHHHALTKQEFGNLRSPTTKAKLGVIDEDDANLWDTAVAKALESQGIENNNNRKMPQFVRTYRETDDSGDDVCDSLGARIFHVTPGLMDERLCPTHLYALALAIYIDQKLDRSATERISVVVDVRGGVGWRNLHAANQLPFIQHTCQLLLKMFPERLSRAIVFPIPASFVWLWTIASRCIEPKTREKIGLLSGAATIAAPPPTDQMVSYMSEKTAKRLEQERVAAFIH